MMDKNTHKVYEQRLIAFVDILGWSEECLTESSKLTAATQAIDDVAISYCRFIKDEMKKITRINPMYLSVQFAAFSDSFAISMPASFGCRIISSAAELCRKLLHIGFLTRGGITVGDLHHVDNIIFGPALIEAVRLEKEAVYPRLICSPKLIDHLETFNLQKSGHKECEHVVVDHLGRRIANLFEVLGISDTGHPLNAHEIFGITGIEKIVEFEIHRHSKDRSDKEAEKWRYMRDILPVMLNGLQMAHF